MFQIMCDPSSGSMELCLTEIRSGSLMFVVCLVGVWQRNFEPQFQKLRRQTPTKHTTNICEPLQVISVKNSSILPDDSSHTIRNMLGVIFNFVSFKLLYNVNFNL